MYSLFLVSPEGSGYYKKETTDGVTMTINIHEAEVFDTLEEVEVVGQTLEGYYTWINSFEIIERKNN